MASPKTSKKSGVSPSDSSQSRSAQKKAASSKKTSPKKVSNVSKQPTRFGYAVNVLSDDHPGIVAGLSEAIARLGGNIESCSQTVLSGYFTLLMTITLDQDWDPNLLVHEILTERGLEESQITCKRIAEKAADKPKNDADIFVLTAFGEDRKEIVLSFARFLADKGVNIIDLYGERVGESQFVLIGQVEIDPNDDLQSLLLDLEEIGSEFGFTVKLQHKNIFVATNQLRLER